MKAIDTPSPQRGRRKRLVVAGRSDGYAVGWLSEVELIRLLLRLGSRSLTLMMMKGYAGGLVVSTIECLHIGSLGLRSDDVSVSFTVCGSRYFGNLAHKM